MRARVLGTSAPAPFVTIAAGASRTGAAAAGSARDREADSGTADRRAAGLARPPFIEQFYARGRRPAKARDVFFHRVLVT